MPDTQIKIIVLADCLSTTGLIIYSDQIRSDKFWSRASQTCQQSIFSFFSFHITSILTLTKCRMTLSSSTNPTSCCTIPTGKGEISLYLHGFGEVGVDTVLAWWH